MYTTEPIKIQVQYWSHKIQNWYIQRC